MDVHLVKPIDVVVIAKILARASSILLDAR
jgi:hypothetical protein